MVVDEVRKKIGSEVIENCHPDSFSRLVHKLHQSNKNLKLIVQFTRGAIVATYNAIKNPTTKFPHKNINKVIAHMISGNKPSGFRTAGKRS